MHARLSDRVRLRRAIHQAPFPCEAFEPRHLLSAAPVGIAFDTYYGEGGAAPLPLELDFWFDAAADASGRLLAAGHLSQPGGAVVGALLRLNGDGSRRRVLRRRRAGNAVDPER